MVGVSAEDVFTVRGVDIEDEGNGGTVVIFNSYSFPGFTAVSSV